MGNTVERKTFYRDLIAALLAEANTEQLKTIYSFIVSYLRWRKAGT